MDYEILYKEIKRDVDREKFDSMMLIISFECVIYFTLNVLFSLPHRQRKSVLSEMIKDQKTCNFMHHAFLLAVAMSIVCFQTSCAVLSHCFTDCMSARESPFFV